MRTRGQSASGLQVGLVEQHAAQAGVARADDVDVVQVADVNGRFARGAAALQRDLEEARVGLSRPPRRRNPARSRTSVSGRADPGARAACRSRSTRPSASGPRAQRVERRAGRHRARTPTGCSRRDRRAARRAPPSVASERVTPACSRIEIEEQPAAARVGRRADDLAGRRAAPRMRFGSGQRRRRDADALPGERVTDAVPVGKDQDAAGVQEDSLEGHARILVKSWVGSP